MIVTANNISTNGNYLAITADPSSYSGYTGPNAVDLYEIFDNGFLHVVPAAGVTAGSVTIALYRLTSGTFDAASTAIIATLTGGTNNFLSLSAYMPCAGLRIVVAGLTGGNISAAQLILTKR